jgi:serine/threonine-protein kinase
MPDPARADDNPDAMPESVVASQGGSRAIFGRYRVLARLGRGGMAEVFVTAAEGAAGVKKLAVVKRLRADLTKDEDPEAVEAGERFRNMFLAEAQLSARLNHPNIVHTYEVGEERGSLFIAMEYVEGQSLHTLNSALQRAGKAIPAAMSVRVMCEVLSALHYAHELTDIGGERLVIVHRDVSPQNVMLTYDGGVKLVDFGVAKASRSSVSTEVGTLKGKVRYMAPEQVAGANVDRRADIFAVGVLLWELLAQKRLTRGENDAQSLLSLVRDDAPSLLVEAPAVDPGLAAVVMRALNRNPDQRYQTALEMRTALEGFLAETHEHVTSESIGLLVRTTFATEREKMADRVRKTLARPSHTDEGIVVDWGAEHSIADSGASKAPSRSASRPILGSRDNPLTLPTVTENLDGYISAPLPFTPSPSQRPQRRRTAFLIPLVAFLAAVGGAGGVMFMFKDRMNSSSGVTSQLTPPPEERGVAEAPRAAGSVAAPLVAEPAPAPVASSVLVADPAGAAAKPQSDKNYEKWAAKNGKSGKDKGESPEPTKKEASVTPAETGEKGFLTIDTYPWTKVTVNGRALGSTPLVKAPLAAGAYTVVLENPDEKISEHVTVTIKAGETVSKRLAF